MPGSDEKEDIVDFRQSLVKKLQSDLNEALTTQDEITKGSRIYWQRVHAIHQAVVVLLEADSLKAMLSCLQDDVCPMLGFDVIQLFMSKNGDAAASSILIKPAPFQLNLAPGRETAVIDTPAQLEQLFPDHGSTISVALLLPLAGKKLTGILALGSRDATRFDAGLAYEPYIFLARVIERLTGRW